MSLRPKKSLGQHFLTDQNIIDKIADAIPATPGNRVIEIGPGTGALTEALLQRFDNLLAVELDDRAIALLNKKFDKLKIHHGNVLDVDWQELSIGKEKTHVVGNLPYYITSQILFALLEQRSVLSDAILMMQKEVAERLVADIRTKDYGILSVQTQLMSSPEILFPVSRHCFKPQPNVESAMVKLTFNKGNLDCTDQHLKTVVRTAFNQRRKKLSNALKPIIPKKELPEGFDFDKRAEAWLPAEYEKLTAHFEENGILT
ncbi:16S rRNA (adenine(1518)-N(6)/adenine(1519)-N(6))-dimethyltransferase RsmA [Fodinibius salsisoli]|uniref:Ribosomal RNA small subunit methyltransferase A n=1 Tax=Fodinibius salsisoli TaxID=2820877 RepID=A0ABT3PPP5_9BACT|nr:16S rRNA (adenine(1518)-N(6)/adenine(1519)-N(6))-dimethyltransferase RsmA [Fodinibius salsisoli]MCW9707832.1 ribosomal RNA small subunit methyltransferase A [Fodinibius salsisoli]